jgi:hypothetical protein
MTEKKLSLSIEDNLNRLSQHSYELLIQSSFLATGRKIYLSISHIAYFNIYKQLLQSGTVFSELTG